MPASIRAPFRPLGDQTKGRAPALALGLAVTLALALGLSACDSRNAYVAPPPPKVTVAKPAQMKVMDYMEFTGATQSVESVDLVARVQGTLTAVNFADGAFVKKGDLLCVIEPEPFEAALQQARAALATQEAAFRRAETELSRSTKLFEAKAGSQSDVVNWQQQRDTARAGMASAKAQIDVAQINLSYTRITAPFDGRISRRLVDPGNLVGPGAKAQLATILRYQPIHAYFNMNERDLLRLRASRDRGKDNGPPEEVPLELALANEQGYPHKGTMNYADLGVDQNTGTILLRGVFSNDHRDILPGMFVRIRVIVDELDKALVVPERALGQDQSGHYLLVVNDKNMVEQRPVVLGPLQNGQQVIAKGLAPTDRVVTVGILRVRPGATVEPVEAAPGQQGQGQGQGQTPGKAPEKAKDGADQGKGS